jgi:hypothetical protein
VGDHVRRQQHTGGGPEVTPMKDISEPTAPERQPDTAARNATTTITMSST